jgi:hypothetical protein
MVAVHFIFNFGSGRFRLVVGIGWGDHAADLRAHGADIVVADLRELSLDDLPM